MHDWKAIVQERIATLRLNLTAETDLTDELAQHLEDQYREMRTGGASDEDAYRSAIAELDDVYPLEAGVQKSQRMPTYEPVPLGDSRRGNLLEDFWRDLRYAGRTMRKSPMFVLFVVLTLGLGIGANTTVFTVINTLVLNPLPVSNPSTLMAVSAVKSQATSKSAAGPLPLSYADLKDYEARNDVFASLAGYSAPRVLTWRTETDSQRIFAELVTCNYFSTLGLSPAVGRFFLPEEDEAPGAHPVAVMNYGTWQTRFGGSPDIIGKTLRINNLVLTIVGVAPPKFIGVNAIFGPDLWIPAAMSEALLPNEMPNAFTDRNKTVFQGAGRLKPAATQALAQANLTTIAADLAREYRATNEGRGVAVRPIREVVYSSASSGSTLFLFASAGLLVVVGIVLLIACSNVANLLLARSATRQQEVDVRMAMGANRSRLVRQLLTESVSLGILSGMVGFFIGYAGLKLSFGALPGAANFIAPKLDAAVFVFTLAISLATGFVFGIIPAFRVSGASVAETLKQEARTIGRSTNKITVGNILLVGQIAFSFVLLVTATLFLRSIGRAYEMDPGFQTSHLVILMTNPGQAGYTKAQTRAYYKDVRERSAAIPDVDSVSWSSNLPLWSRVMNGLEVEGREQGSQADKLTAVLNTADINYFETAGVSIDRGRAFTNVDQETSPPVAIVNEKLAHDYWSNGDALGKRIRLPNEKQMRQIVGIARTANYTNWGEPPQLCAYVPLEQNYSDSMVLYVRSKGDPGRILTPIQHAVREAGPQVLATDIRTGPTIIDNGLFQAKVGVTLLSVFGFLALGLASIGLYGIMAYSVNQRKREIGLRMALGAADNSVPRLILRQGMSLVFTGMAIGFVASLFAGSLLERLLYGIRATDPISVAGAAIVLSGVALLACYLPARWASRVDPLVALREG